MTHVSWKLIAVLFFITIAGWSVWLAKPASADAPPYNGLDLVLLIDQSGSMGGKDFGSDSHPEPNDRNQLRFEGTQAIMDILGTLYYSNRISETITLRVGVVDFGDHTINPLDKPYETIAPRTADDWKLQYDDIKPFLTAKHLADQNKVSKNLGNTDPMLAFAEARRIFDQMQQDDETAGLPSHRLKAIIVLTDGAPFVPRSPYCSIPCEQENFDSAQYFEQLIERVASDFPEHRIFVVALNDSDDNYWPKTKAYWETITKNRATKVDDNRTFGAKLQEILGKLVYEAIGLPEPIGVPCGRVPIRPYLSLVQFTMHKPVADANVSVFVPGATKPLQDGDLGVTLIGLDSFIQIARINDPPPGDWRLECPFDLADRPQIFMQDVQIQTSLESLKGLHAQGLPVRVEVRLYGSNGELLKEYADKRFALDVKATIVGPTKTFEISPPRVSDGIYAGSFIPEESGDFTAQVLATTYDPDGNQLVIVNTKPTPFAVEPLQASWRGGVTFLQYQNVPLEYELRYRSGAPFSLDGLIESGYQVSAEANVKSGSQSWTVPLTLNPAGTLTGSLKVDASGTYQHGLVVKIKDGAGNESVLVNGQVGQFQVTPTTLVRFALVKPTAKQIETALMPFSPWDFDVEVEYRDVDNKPLAPTNCFDGTPTQFFDLRVTDPNKKDRSKELVLKPTASPGRYRATTTSLSDLGIYRIEVAPVAKLKPNCLYDVTAIAANVEVVENRTQYAARLGAMGVLGLLVIGALVWGFVEILSRRNPLKGTLTVTDFEGGIIQPFQLSTVGRNHVTYKGNRLYAATRLKLLSVKREGPSDNIRVTVIHDNNDPQLTNEEMMNGSVKYLKFNLQLKYELPLSGSSTGESLEPWRR